MSIFYFISKFLPLLILPLGFSLFLLIVGHFFRLRWASFVAFTLLFISSLGICSQLLWRLIESPFARHATIGAPNADVIVVLSGGRHPAPGSGRVVEWHDPDRFLAGVDLYRLGKSPLILFTGGFSPFQPGLLPEGEIYLKEAEALGIPSSSLITTPPVSNTAEEAFAIRMALPSRSRILLVTSAFHMQRAKRLIERQGFVVVPFPVDFQSRGLWAGSLWLDPLLWIPSPESLYSTSRALRELIGRFVYRVL